jgi:hypothetical protein
MKKLILLLSILISAFYSFSNGNPYFSNEFKQKAAKYINLHDKIMHPVQSKNVILKNSSALVTLDSLLSDNGYKKVFKYDSKGLLINAKYYIHDTLSNSTILSELHEISHDASGNQTLYVISVPDNNGQLITIKKTETTYDAKGRITSEIISLDSANVFLPSTKTVNTYTDTTTRTDNYRYDISASNNWKLTDYTIITYNPDNQIIYSELWSENIVTGEIILACRYFYKNYINEIATLVSVEQYDESTSEWVEAMRFETELDSEGRIASELIWICFLGMEIPLMKDVYTYNSDNQIICAERMVIDFGTGEMVGSLKVETTFSDGLITAITRSQVNDLTGEMIVTENYEISMIKDPESSKFEIPFNYDDNADFTDLVNIDLYQYGRVMQVKLSLYDSINSVLQSVFTTDYYYSENHNSASGTICKNNFKVGPNPFTNQISIGTPSQTPCQAILYNSSGKIVINRSINGNATIQLPNEEKGLYFLELKDNSGILFHSKILRR